MRTPSHGPAKRNIDRARTGFGERGQPIVQFVFLSSLALVLGCVDLSAPWVTHPRTGGSVTGGTIPTGGNLGSGGSLGEDAPIVEGGSKTGGQPGETGGSPTETGGVPGNGGAAFDALPTTGGIPRTGGAIIDAPIATGGAPETGGAPAPDAKPATGGATIVDAQPTTGGSPGSGGAVVIDAPMDTRDAIATGGTFAPYNCDSPFVLTGGAVTNFSDWNASTGLWGTSPKLTGSVFRYANNGATMNEVKIEGTPVGMHLIGTMPSGSFGGGGILFTPCVTLTSFTAVNFEVYGRVQGCTIDLLVQTYDQRPYEANPGGTCRQDAGTACYRFPGISLTTDLPSNPIPPSSPITMSKTLANFMGWSPAKAAMAVGLQWQFVPVTNSSNDVPVTCTVDLTITNIRFQ